MDPSRHKILKYRDILGCVILCVMIFTPMLLGVIQKDKTVSSSEKRTLSTFPKTPQSLKGIQSYPRLFETYYADHFGFRDWLIKKYKTVKYKIGDSPSADLTIGKNDWLFLGNIKETYTKFHDPFGDVRNVNLYTEKQLKTFANNITTFEAWLAERSIPYILIIPPNKHTVYFDQLPSNIKKEAPSSALDQLVTYLRANTSITVIDLREALADERKSHDVFHKTDTHWNHNGANRAQLEILSIVKSKLGKGKHPKLYEMKEKWPYFGDLAGMLGVDVLGDRMPVPIFDDGCWPEKKSSEIDFPKTTVWQCDTDTAKALIYHDSFFVALKPYFVRYFSQSTYIPTAATPKSVKAQIEHDKPDIFIEEWVERKLPKPYVTGYQLNPDHAPIQSNLHKSDIAVSFMDQFRQRVKLRNMEPINDVSSRVVELRTTGKDPIIYFPELDLKPNQPYSLHVKFESDTKSAARLYYSTTDTKRFPFSDINSVRLDVNIGENDLRFNFSSAVLGKRLRLDILAGQGSVRISHIDLYRN